MDVTKVKSLLFLSSSRTNRADAILFHLAKYWAHQGKRVLFICNSPLTSIPLPVGKGKVYIDALQLIQFMYLPDWKALLYQLYSINLRRHPVSVIMVKNLEDYFTRDPEIHNHEDHISLICASFLFAATLCSTVVSPPIFLISEYMSESSTVETILIKNFFPNVWQINESEDGGEKTISLTKLSVAENNEIVKYTIRENASESLLNFDEVFQNIIQKC